MWFGDLAGTGFGSVTLDLGRALLADHDMRFVSQNELGEVPEPFASRTYVVNDPSGWHALRDAGGVVGLLNGTLWPDGWVPDAAVILGDYVGVNAVVMRSPEAFAAVPTWHYMPVEGVDLPPGWSPMWRIVHPIAMSEFGADQIERIMGERPPVVYHGIDTDQFRPVSELHPLYIGDHKLRSKTDCKRFFGADPASMWLLRTDRNMPRKRYASLFRALAPVLATHRETFLITHCRTEDEGGSLDMLKSKYPPGIASHILNTGFHDQVGGASRDILTALYNAADIYVSVSAEGFGLTIAEALACGTPAVGLDYSAVPEVIGPAGLVAPVAHLVDSEYDFPWAAVDERIFGGLVAGLLDDPAERLRLGALGPDHVREHFQWAVAAAQFGRIMAARAEVAA